MADTNKVKFGLSMLAVAKLIPPAEFGGVPTWDTPIMWPGAVSMSEDADASESSFYADNMKYWGTYIDNGFTGEVEVAKILDEIGVLLWNWEIDALGGIAQGAPGAGGNFALMYQREGDASSERNVIYSCSAGAPSTEAATTEDTIEPQTFTAEYTAVPVNVGDGKFFSKYSLTDDPSNPAAHAAYVAWYDKVALPVYALGLQSITVTSVAGSASGQTTVTVTPSVPSGMTALYQTAATVTLPALDDEITTGWQAFTGGQDYAATTGNEFAVIYVDTGNKVRYAGKTAVTAAA